MSKQVKVLKGQTLVDIAIQEMGDASFVLAIAELNDLNVTDDLTAGQMITVPDYDTAFRNTVNLFSDDANKPASGINADEGDEEDHLEGIEYWAIENDFVVQ